MEALRSIAMSVTTQEVRDALDDFVTAEVHTDDNAAGVVITVRDQEIGEFYRALRENDFDAESRRVGDMLVSTIEAEPRGLGELFG